jgi:cellobiose-specific phosphotransferase system component IIA
VKSYLCETGEIRAAIQAAAAALRQQRFDESLALLKEAESRRRRLESGRSSLFHVAGRFYFGGLAYYHFRQGDFDRADQSMIEAGKSIQAALESEPCLLPFAAVSLDIPLKRARIARARLCWAEVRAHSATLREAASDRAPLCTLFGREPIHHATIADQLLSRPDVKERLIPAIRYLAERSVRLELTDRVVGQLYLLPGLLIEYP